MEIGVGFIHAHEPVHIGLGELTLIDNLVHHQVAFEIIHKGITENLALLVGNIDVRIQHVAENAGNSIVFHILGTLQEPVDFSCFL